MLPTLFSEHTRAATALNSSSDTNWIPIAIAAVAAAISLVALWRTHFARFHMLAVPGSLGVSVYPIRSEDEKWYILSFETRLTMTNAGVRPGMLLGLRLRIHCDDPALAANALIVPARFLVIDSDDALREGGRFSWLDSATESWQPTILLPRETIRQDIVFEQRIDHPIAGPLSVAVEGFTRPKRHWHRLGEWKIVVTPAIFSELIQRLAGGGFHFPPDGVPVESDPAESVDLLDYLRIAEEELPEDPFTPPSYLDYPETRDDNDDPTGGGASPASNRRSPGSRKD